MFSQIDFVVNPVLHFFLIQQSDLRRRNTLYSSDIVRVVVLAFVVHVVDLIVVYVVLLRHQLPILNILSIQNIIDHYRKNS